VRMADGVPGFPSVRDLAGLRIVRRT